MSGASNVAAMKKVVQQLRLEASVSRVKVSPGVGRRPGRPPALPPLTHLGKRLRGRLGRLRDFLLPFSGLRRPEEERSWACTQ